MYPSFAAASALSIYLKSRGVLLATLAFTMSLGLQYENMDYLTLYSETFCLIVNQDHPLAKREKVQISELSSDSFVFIDRNESPYVYDYLLALLTNNGISPNIVSQPERIDTVLLLVEAGVGITVMPKHLIVYENPALRFLEIEGGNEDITIDIVATWKKTNLNPTISLFLKELNTLNFEQIVP
ncbi:hypothetical protein GC098_24600 [Paenibacillus sp. LMG 31458]|uniref:LysR substrate-binding domain-containing protein n=1 Tax=Paenibacillus phytorum TaxID=2654977 RepID=A0ABX1Y156_9BACL|nr:LysR family substrate-binding domain-containing protein [Paenibacillus phytorum]NOU74538.1 hypothetical protein [Paenibacillus phytorum]